MEAEILREAVSRPQAKKTAVALDLVAGGRSVSAVADAIGISRQHLSAMHNRPPPRPRGRPPLPDAELVADIGMLVADLPTPAFAGAGSMAIAACTPFCAAKPNRPGAQRPIQSASTAS